MGGVALTLGIWRWCRPLLVPVGNVTGTPPAITIIIIIMTRYSRWINAVVNHLRAPANFAIPTPLKTNTSISTNNRIGNKLTCQPAQHLLRQKYYRQPLGTPRLLAMEINPTSATTITPTTTPVVVLHSSEALLTKTGHPWSRGHQVTGSRAAILQPRRSVSPRTHRAPRCLVKLGSAAPQSPRRTWVGS